MHQTRTVAAILVGAFTLSLGARVPDPQDDWRSQNRRHDLYYEGLAYPRQVAGAPITLTSFTTYREQFDPKVDPELAVDFFANDDQPYALVAREQSLDTYYWMETIQPRRAARGMNHFAGWTTKEVLADPRIKADAVGIVVWLGQVDSDRVAPAVLRRSTTISPSFEGTYVADFEPEKVISKITYSVLTGCGPTVAWPPVAEGVIGQGYPHVPFRIEFSLRRAPSNVATLQIDYKTLQGVDDSMQICFAAAPVLP